MKKGFYVILLSLILCISNVYADDITSSSTITLNDSKISSNMIDDKESTYGTVSSNDIIKITSDTAIKGIYISYYYYTDFTGSITSGDQSITFGEDGFLHEYIDLSTDFTDLHELTIKYNNQVKICDIYVLSEGELPDYIEVWDEPCEKADIILFTTHSDDEQLFFLGLLPTYVARGAYVQVVYFANHNDTPSRLHEQLHGLYTVGIRNYPVMGYIPDAYSTSLDGAITNLNKAGITIDDAQKFQVEMIRRFKPQVVVDHDEKGEYSHGQHILNTYLMETSITKAADETYDLESAEKYGTWQIHKLYLHLYEQNQITMDYDIPLDYFNGKTAYEVSKEGYKKHNSQQWTWFTRWINGSNNEYTKATDITKYSPCIYGLYFTDVGEDVNKNDMMENLTYYKVQEENERKAQEEEAKRLEEENNKKNVITKVTVNKNNNFLIYIISGIVILFVIIILIIVSKKKKHHKKRR